jgi:glyoxylase-like metal-dependent hydrolase (beta-lactamase superfamily II)
MRIARPGAWVTTSAAMLAVAAAISLNVSAQQPPRASAATQDLEVLEVRPNFHVVVGAGSNVGIQAGPDGAVVVDAGAATRAGELATALKKLTEQPIRYVINTNADADHVGGNELVSRAGRSLLNADGALGGLTNGGAAAILAAEPVLTRMSAPTGQQAPFATAAWPTETFDQRRKYMFLNGEGIEVLRQPSAHSDGDVIVVFRRSDVIMAGDVLDLTQFPKIDLSRGGSIRGEIDALNLLVDTAIPSVPIVSKDGGTYIVPGHGYICDQLDVVEYRDMITIIRDRVDALITSGATLERVKASNPTQGYRARYGSDAGATDAFVEAIFTSLSREKRR